MSFLTDQNIHIIAFDYTFCPIDTSKYEPWLLSYPKQMTILASPPDSINVLIKYNYEELIRP